MSPPSKRSTRSTGKAPDIALPQNGKMPQASKSTRKTRQHQSNDADKDIELEPPVPTPVGPRPVPRKKPSPASGAAPGAFIDDEAFIPACTLQKKIVSDPPPPPPVSPPCDPSPVSDKTPSPRPSQPRHPPPLRLPSPSSPIVRDPGCTPSGSDFESTTTAEQQLISRMRPEKCPVSQELLDEEDDEAFEEGIHAEELHAQLTKGKKGKGKKSDVKGPFKSGPIPEEAKQRAFAIHANFEKQIQDLAAEIGKAPQLLFSLVGEGPLLSRRALTRWGAFEAWYGIHGEIKKSKHTRTDFQLASPQEWTKLVAAERVKYCKDNLGDKWEDPEALNTLFEPIM
ncbi:hypothetical protein DXG01_009072, partial [Tephrocybe rancida]